jgi:hypothetical protein
VKYHHGGGSAAHLIYQSQRAEITTREAMAWRGVNAWDCARRLKSCGYTTQRHVRKHEAWHVFETDKGLVAITRHQGGRWEIRRMPPAVVG